jgi:hypothetical protein
MPEHAYYEQLFIYDIFYALTVVKFDVRVHILGHLSAYEPWPLRVMRAPI